MEDPLDRIGAEKEDEKSGNKSFGGRLPNLNIDCLEALEIRKITNEGFKMKEIFIE